MAACKNSKVVHYILTYHNFKESSVSIHICKLPSRYRQPNGSSIASVFNAHSELGVVFKSFLLPNSRSAENSLRSCYVNAVVVYIVFSLYNIHFAIVLFSLKFLKAF